MAAYLGAFGLLLLLPLHGVPVALAALPSLGAVLPAVAVVFLVGLWDDIRGLRPWQKLAGQIIASVLAVVGGVHMTAVAGFILPPWLGIIGTVVWLVACANAVNLIDGVDGLAAGIALFATFTTLVAALFQGNMTLAYATAPMVGALFGFLRYNFNGASIFLGDSGSLTLGFLLGCYGVFWGEKAATVLGITAPLFVLAIPLLDAGLAVVRRFLRQQPIFQADRGHIHHRLLARGFSPRRVVLMLYAVAGACAVFSLLLGPLQDRLAGPLLVLFVVGVFAAVHFLGYVEFGTARRLIIEGAFRRLLNAQLSLDAVAQELRDAATLEECWEQLSSAYASFGFSSIELRIDGRCYLHPPEIEAGPVAWQVSIQLEAGNQLVLRREVGMRNHTTLAAGFVDMLQKELGEKVGRLASPAERVRRAAGGA